MQVVIHTKRHACDTVSAQQMLNVTNGPKSVTKDSQGMNASWKEIQVFSCLEGREKLWGREAESASANSRIERSAGWAGATL